VPPFAEVQAVGVSALVTLADPIGVAARKQRERVDGYVHRAVLRLVENPCVELARRRGTMRREVTREAAPRRDRDRDDARAESACARVERGEVAFDPRRRAPGRLVAVEIVDAPENDHVRERPAWLVRERLLEAT